MERTWRDAWARSCGTQERTGVIGIAGNGWWPPMAVVVFFTMIPSSLRPKDVFADEKRLYGQSTRHDNGFFRPFSPRGPATGATTTRPVARQRVPADPERAERRVQEAERTARTSSAYFSSFEGPTPGMRASASASAGIASAMAVRVASVKTT